MKTNAKIRIANPADLRLAVHVNPGDTYEWSNVLLARASADGGLGVRGMHERVTLLGGELRAGPDGDSWCVDVELPRAIDPA
jgi:signal transduction histidine kinase